MSCKSNLQQAWTGRFLPLSDMHLPKKLATHWCDVASAGFMYYSVFEASAKSSGINMDQAVETLMGNLCIHKYCRNSLL